MAVAASTCRVYATGTSTVMTAEACGGSVVDYQITNTAKRVIDPDASVAVYANGVLQAATAYTLNHLFGRIKFGSAPTAPITITASYLPLLELDETAKAALTLDRDEIDTTVFKSGEYRTRILGAKTAELKLTTLGEPSKDYDTGAGTLKLETVLTTALLKLLELTWPGSSVTFRMFAYANSNENPDDVLGRHEGNFTFLSTQAATNKTKTFSWSDDTT